MSLTPGTYRARGVSGALGTTSTGKPQVAVLLQALDDPFAGETITWFGFFTTDTEERTFESLRNLGWKTDDLDTLDGITDNEVNIVLQEDEYEGRVKLKVAWINKVGGLALKTPMAANEAKAFAAQMKGRAMASRKAAGAPAVAPPQGTRPAAQRPNPPGATMQRRPAPAGGGAAPAPRGSDRSPDLADDDIPFIFCDVALMGEERWWRRVR